MKGISFEDFYRLRNTLSRKMALKAIPFALCRESSGPFAVRVLATLMDVPVNVIVQPQQLVASPVCRCLFGPVDHDQNLRDLAKLRKVLDDQSSQRWNFDFRLGRPIYGKRYGWESVDDENTNIHQTFNRFSILWDHKPTETRA